MLYSMVIMLTGDTYFPAFFFTSTNHIANISANSLCICLDHESEGAIPIFKLRLKANNSSCRSICCMYQIIGKSFIFGFFKSVLGCFECFRCFNSDFTIRFTR